MFQFEHFVFIIHCSFSLFISHIDVTQGSGSQRSTNKRILPLHQADAGPAYRVVEGEAEECPRRPAIGGATLLLALGILLPLPLRQRAYRSAVRCTYGLVAIGPGVSRRSDRGLPGQSSRLGEWLSGKGGAFWPKGRSVTRGRGPCADSIACPWRWKKKHFMSEILEKLDRLYIAWEVMSCNKWHILFWSDKLYSQICITIVGIMALITNL